MFMCAQIDVYVDYSTVRIYVGMPAAPCFVTVRLRGEVNLVNGKIETSI